MSNNNVVSISNKLISSHTSAALNIHAQVCMVKAGPIWGKKSGYKIPTMVIKVIKGYTLNADGKRDKDLEPGKMLAVGCSNLKEAHSKCEMPDGFLYNTDELNTNFVLDKDFVLSVDDKFNTTIRKVASDAKPVKAEPVAKTEDVPF